MANCDDHFACAVREVTRRGGRLIWGDPGRLRSRLQYEMGSVSPGQGALLDALVIAAMHGIPHALLDHEDLQPRLFVLGESVGPLLAAEAVGAWTRAVAEPELVCVLEAKAKACAIEVAAERELDMVDLGSELGTEGDVALEQRVLTLVEKLRPPPPVSINA